MEVDGRGDALVVDGEGELHEPGQACAGLEVADVGLDRADERGRRVVGAPAGEHGVEGLDLDGVAEGGARAVALDVLEGVGLHAGLAAGLGNQALLCERIRRREAVGAAVLIHSNALHDSVNAVACGLGCAEGLHDDDADALRAPKAVRAGVKGLAAPVGGEEAGLAERDEGLGRQNEVCTADDCAFAAALLDVAHSDVESHERRRARRVDCDGGALEVVLVRDAVRANRARRACRHVCAADYRGAVPALHLRVVRAAHSHSHRSAAPRKHVCVLACVVERLLRARQQKPLLGVHCRRLRLCDVEEAAVEQVHIFDEPALPHVHLPGRPRRLVVKALCVKAVSGNTAHSVHAVHHQLPELVFAPRAGEPARHAHNRHGLGGSGRRRPGDSRAELVDHHIVVIVIVPGEVACELLDCWVLIQHRWGQLHLQPVLQLACEADDVCRAHPVVGERHVQPHLHLLVHLLRNALHDALCNLLRLLRKSLRALRRSNSCGSCSCSSSSSSGSSSSSRSGCGCSSCCSCWSYRLRKRSVVDSPLGKDFEAVLEEEGLAAAALDLVGAGAGDGVGLDEDDCVGLDLVALGNRVADAADEGEGAGLPKVLVDLVDEDELLLLADLDGERSAAAHLDALVSVGGGLDVLGVVVLAVDDDEVLLAARDVELAVVEEAEVACAEEVSAVAALELCAEGLLCDLWLVVVPVCGGLCLEPNLADVVGGELCHRLSVYDDDLVCVAVGAHADRDAGARALGLDKGGPSDALLEVCGPEVCDGGNVAELLACDKEDGLGHAVDRHEGVGVKAAVAELVGEELYGLGADELGAAEGELEVGEVECLHLLRCDPERADVVAKVGPAGDDTFGVGGELEPAVGLLEEGEGGHEVDGGGAKDGVRHKADEPHVVVQRNPPAGNGVVRDVKVRHNAVHALDQALVRDHNAFRRPCGPRRVLQERRAAPR